MAKNVMVVLTEQETRVRDFYRSLNERDRRRFAGLQVMDCGRGGLTRLAAVLGCSPKTIRKGKQEVLHPPQDLTPGRIRKKGGDASAVLIAGPSSARRFARC